jgi:hypothetical protein
MSGLATIQELSARIEMPMMSTNLRRGSFVEPTDLEFCWRGGYMNKQEGGPEVYWRGAFAFALFGLIVINLGMIALGVARYPALLLQSGARTFVAEPISVLVAYALAVVCIARTHGTYWDWILRTAIFWPSRRNFRNHKHRDGERHPILRPRTFSTDRLHAQRLHIMGIRRIPNSTLSRFHPCRITCSGLQRRHLYAHRGGSRIPYSIFPCPT